MNEFQDSIKVVRGNPTAEELATVIALVQAAAEEERNSAASASPTTRSTWNRNNSQLRANVVPGVGQWRTSFHDGLN